MDPFVAGMFFVGATGGVFFILHALEESGFPINGTAVRFVAELGKYGAILWLMKKLAIFL